jgi:hypothetical protein
MGLIKEPIDVDFVVDSRPLTKKEELVISEFIRSDKEKRRLQAKGKTKAKAIRNNKQPA